jgi:hypothetical protein
LEQLSDYLYNKDKLSEEVSRIENKHKIKVSKDWVGVLVGRSVSEELSSFLNSLPKKAFCFQFYILILKRYRNDLQSFVITELTYRNQKSVKYNFNGEVLSTRGLALALFSKFTEERKPKKKEDFNKYLSFIPSDFRNQVLKEYDLANQMKSKPYFMGSPLLLGDGTKLVVYDSWNLCYGKNLLKIAKEMKYSVTRQ